MKGNKLSPLTRLLVSLSLVVGILVAGLTRPSFLRAAAAQTDFESGGDSVSVVIGNILPVSKGEVVGQLIGARGVLVNGVPTDFLFDGKIVILDSTVISESLMSIDGVGISGEIAPKESVAVNGTLQETTPYGVGISGEVAPQTDVVVSGSSFGVQVSGGQLLGDNIRVEGETVRGDNLRVVGATVSGVDLCVENVFVTLPGS